MYFHLYLVEQPISGVTILAATGSGLSDAALTLGSLEDRNLEDQCHIVSAEPLVPATSDGNRSPVMENRSVRKLSHGCAVPEPMAVGSRPLRPPLAASEHPTSVSHSSVKARGVSVGNARRQRKLSLTCSRSYRADDPCCRAGARCASSRAMSNPVASPPRCRCLTVSSSS
jgi:hypothetical protein